MRGGHGGQGEGGGGGLICFKGFSGKFILQLLCLPFLNIINGFHNVIDSFILFLPFFIIFYNFAHKKAHHYDVENESRLSKSK